VFRLTILWNNELDISAKRLRTVAASPTDCQLLGKTLSCVTLLLRFVYSVRYQTDRQTESNLLEVIATHIHTHAQRERERESGCVAAALSMSAHVPCYCQYNNVASTRPFVSCV